MIEAALLGDAEAVRRLLALPERARAALARALAGLAVDLASQVRRQRAVAAVAADLARSKEAFRHSSTPKRAGKIADARRGGVPAGGFPGTPAAATEAQIASAIRAAVGEAMRP